MSTTSDENSALKNSSGDALEAGRLRVILYTLLCGGLGLTVAMLQPWGPVTGTALTAVAVTVMVCYIIMRDDELGQKFMLACLVAGFMELFADWYLINIHKSLTYMPGGPFVWASPLYMPFAWMGNLFIFGVIGRWFDGKWNLATASVVIGILGGILLPYWEFTAKYAGFWYYHDTPMLGPVPYYIIFGEFFIIAALPLTFRLVKRVSWLASFGTGIVLGLWIFVAYRVGIQICG